MTASGAVEQTVPMLIGQLNAIVRQLEALFPGRKFTLDGHLVGSLGEVVAASMFDLELLPASAEGHDARARDGRLVQVKLTQATKIGITACPEHLLVMSMDAAGRFSIVYNGPGDLAWSGAGPEQKNKQRGLSLSKLQRLDAQVADAARLPIVRPWATYVVPGAAEPQRRAPG